MSRPDPVAEFASMLVSLGKFRRHVPEELRALADDCAMLTQEAVVIGLRSTWVRKTALPAWKAFKVLDANEGSAYDRGQKAITILSQCKDDALVALLGGYIAAVYLMPAAQAVTDAPRTGELPLED